MSDKVSDVPDSNRKKFDRDHYAKIGAIGGKAKVKKGFATMSPERLREVAKKGRANIKNQETNA